LPPQFGLPRGDVPLMTRAVETVVIMPKKLTTISILNFEDELEDLCRKLSSGALAKNEEAITEARVKEICKQLQSDRFGPMGRDFLTLFMRRFRSTGDLADYCAIRNPLFMEAATELARKNKKNLKKINSQRWNNDTRDMQMAREFRRLRPTSHLSATALKAQIGSRRKLRRSASNDAINKGLRLLDEEDGRKHK
jgi:hypothetical protein